MNMIWLLILVCIPAAAFGEMPTIEWGEPLSGIVRHASPWIEGNPEANHSRAFFLMGNVILNGIGDRLTIHALLDSVWIESPCGMHMEPLSDMNEEGKRGFVVQIPAEAVDEARTILVSVIENNVVQYTFPSVILRREGKKLLLAPGPQVIPGTVLPVVKYENARPGERTTVRHLGTKGEIDVPCKNSGLAEGGK